MGDLANKYLGKIIEQKLFDGPGDLPDTLEGLNANDFTAVVYNAVKGIIADLRESGELKPDQNLSAAGITAQILLETGNGKSSLASKYNNFGGIKATPSWKGKTIMIPNSDGNVNWRVYPSVKKGLEEQVRFFLPSKNPRYFKAGVLSAKNAAEHAKRVQDAGYAGSQTDYADRVIKMAGSISKRLEKANPKFSKETTYIPETTTTIPEEIVQKPSTSTTNTNKNTAVVAEKPPIDVPINIGEPNPAQVFLNSRTKVDLNTPIEISNPSTKIFDNSFYNDPRNEQQLKQAAASQKIINSPIEYKKGGKMKLNKYYNLGGSQENGEDGEDEIAKPTNPYVTGKGILKFIKSAADYDIAKAMSKVELPEKEEGATNYDYFNSLNRQQKASIPYKEQMGQRAVELENYKAAQVRKKAAEIGKEIGKDYYNELYNIDDQYAALGVPFMSDQNSWFFKLKNNIYYEPYTCQGIACAIGRKAGAVNAQDYKTRSAKGTKGAPWAIETGGMTVDHADVLAGKGLYPVDDIQAGDIVRHGYKSGHTDHNTTALGPSFSTHGNIKFPAAYGSHWSRGVMESNYYFNPQFDQVFRYLGRTPILQKKLAESQRLNSSYQAYLDQQAIADLPIRKPEQIRTGSVKMPFIEKKQYPDTRRGRKQEQQDKKDAETYYEAYMSKMQKK